MMQIEAALSIVEEIVKALRTQAPAIESMAIRQRIALLSIIDLINGCELNGDSNAALRDSVANILSSIKAVAESALQKGPAQ